MPTNQIPVINPQDADAQLAAALQAQEIIHHAADILLKGSVVTVMLVDQMLRAHDALMKAQAVQVPAAVAFGPRFDKDGDPGAGHGPNFDTVRAAVMVR